MINTIFHFFHVLFHGPYPCGRTKENKEQCCKRIKSNWFNSYTSKDKRKVYCRFCNSLKMMSSEPINLKSPFKW